MTPDLFKYLLTLAYVVLVFWLSWIGMRRTRDIRGFSIGNKDMNPYLIGITLAASIASMRSISCGPAWRTVTGIRLSSRPCRDRSGGHADCGPCLPGGPSRDR